MTRHTCPNCGQEFAEAILSEKRESPKGKWCEHTRQFDCTTLGDCNDNGCRRERDAAPQADTPASPDEAQRTAGTTPSGTMPKGRHLPADSRSAVAAPSGHDAALKRIEECVREIEMIADTFGYDPVEWLADKEDVKMGPNFNQERNAHADTIAFEHDSSLEDKTSDIK